MAFLRIFRTPNPKKFNFNPRHYDPEEEERQERHARYKKLAEKGPEGMKERISARMRSGSGGAAQRELRRKAIMRSNMIMVGVLIFLILLGYGLIQVYLPQLAESMAWTWQKVAPESSNTL